MDSLEVTLGNDNQTMDSKHQHPFNLRLPFNDFMRMQDGIGSGLNQPLPVTMKSSTSFLGESTAKFDEMSQITRFTGQSGIVEDMAIIQERVE
jgi:hypothetical protein